MDEKPDTWDDRLILFVGYLIEKKRKACTIRSYISAIKHVLAQDAVILNENKYLLSSLTKACRYVNDTIRTRLPIQKGMLAVLLNLIDDLFLLESSQPYLSVMYKALFATTYYGLFRIGEVTSGTHPIKSRDVHLATNKNKVLFILRTSKTHWTDVKPQIIKISSIPTKNKRDIKFCPFKLLQDYILARLKYRSDTEPFFVFKDRTPVAPHHMRSLLNRLLIKGNFPDHLYGVHSLRVRRATDLLKIGLKISEIKKLGCWKSNVVYTYLR